MKLTYPIDVVYTWVDDTDLHWSLINKNELNNYSGYLYDKSVVGRFSNHDELKYSIRSVLFNMPWVRYIYIVTDNQIPVWLKQNRKIRIVDHNEILPKKIQRPVYNSLLIEQFIHNIKDLSEHYIYFNDDFFICRPLEPYDFFTSKGSCYRYISKPVNRNADITGISSIDKLERLFIRRKYDVPFFENTFDLVNFSSKKYDQIFYLKHVPYSFIKSDVKRIKGKYDYYLKKTYRNQFRSRNDVMLTYLIAIEEMKSNKFYGSCENNDLLEFILSDKKNNNIEMLFDVFSNKYKFLHFADGEPSDIKFVNIMKLVLEKKYPTPSKYELASTTYDNATIVDNDNDADIYTVYRKLKQINDELINEINNTDMLLKQIIYSKFFHLWQKVNKILGRSK